MIRFITVSVLLSLFLSSSAQVFNGSGGPINNTGQDTYFNIGVSGLSPTTLDSVHGLLQLNLSINHPAVEELTIFLRSPGGIIVEMSLGSSCHGANYIGTTFDSQAATSVTLDSAPYSGTFKPIGYMGRFNNGQNGNGTWELIVHDYLAFVNAGSLLNWSLTFGNHASPAIAFSSSNMPIVFVNSNQSISDYDVVANMGIVDNLPNRSNLTDPWNNYNGKINIHLHGHSTKNFEKKCYSLSTCDVNGNKLDAPIMGMPTEHDWELLAPYQDKSMIRIPLTYDFFRRMGHYAARFVNVELMLNNE